MTAQLQQDTLGRAGLLSIQHYLSTYHPQYINVGGFCLGLIVFLLGGLLVARIMDKRGRK